MKLLLSLLAAVTVLLGGCAFPRTFAKQKGDEIIVAGQRFHTGTRVITWMDPGGYDAYRVERRFAPLAESSWAATIAAKQPDMKTPLLPDMKSPNRYGFRAKALTPEEIERQRGGGWDLPTLQRVVDQFVLHYDVAGVSKQCFKILQDYRDLSVHFMLDVDGTIYQTLDLKERAYHATTSNDRSIGIEIANIGAYEPKAMQALDEWYPKDQDGPYIQVPARYGDPMIHTPNFKGRPARPDLVRGVIQHTEYVQYDLTPQQYAALIKLTAALATVFPKIKVDYPRDAAGNLITAKLPDDQLAAYQGVLGHYHVQENKQDPGPALQWDKLIDGARKLMKLPPIKKPKAAAN